MKTTWNRLASFASIVFITSTLHAATYFVQSLGGADGPPYPFDPSGGTAPISEIGPDQYLVDDSESESLQSGGVTMNSLDPNDPGSGGGSSNQEPPNIRNYAKYSQQIFSLLDTNSLAETDTNLLNACAAMPTDTNTAPTLFIHPYGPNAVIIRADNFDYSQTNADFALLVCDKVETPTWKAVDFAGASDAQDGWLVQGTVPNAKVSGTMFMLITNINLTYPAFFQAIPYTGPQVVINGTPSQYDVVSNIVTFNAQVLDLSGVTNEFFEVNVDGSTCRYSLSTSNTFTVDTQYTPAGVCNVYLQVLNHASVADPVNPPDHTKLFFTGLTSIPLDFENDTYLMFASDNASPDIGTNYFYYSINKEQDVAGIIFDPSDNHVVLAFTNHVPFATTVYFGWNFTEADGVTPYTNDTYVVRFIAFDPADLSNTNSIRRHHVRLGTGCFLTWQEESPGTTDGTYLNSQAATWIDGTLSNLYQNVYNQFTGISQYGVWDIGPYRNHASSTALSAPHPLWAPFMAAALTNSFIDGSGSNWATYSDITIAQAHGSGCTVGDDIYNHYMTNKFDTFDLQRWVLANSPFRPYDLMRKSAFWSCYSSSFQGTTNLAGFYSTFPDACGILPTGVQLSALCEKNCGLFFRGEVPQGGFGGNSSVVTAQVAEFLDQTWVCGKNQYPGGCDPTYSFQFAVNATRGVYNPQVDAGDPVIAGLPQMIYTINYDAQLTRLDFHNVKTH